MGKKRKKEHNFRREGLRAKLVIDDWFAEKPLYRIKATTKEKDKGIRMLELIENNFNISTKDRLDFIKKRLEELNKESMKPTKLPKFMRKNQIKFTRDPKTGQIISPFKSKKKIFER